MSTIARPQMLRRGILRSGKPAFCQAKVENRGHKRRKFRADQPFQGSKVPLA